MLRRKVLGVSELGFGGGLDGGETVQFVLLACEPVLDGLDHGQLLMQVSEARLGVGRGQGLRLGVLKAIFGEPEAFTLSLLLASPSQETPRYRSAGRLAIAVLALGLGCSGLDQAVSFDIESGHVVAARANHHQGCSHRRSPFRLSPLMGFLVGRSPISWGYPTGFRLLIAEALSVSAIPIGSSVRYTLSERLPNVNIRF